jgi:phosphoenolpyruvate carboxykinase (ATP)
MVRHPFVYAQLLAKKLKEHRANCWLVNTGWTGGPYGVGSRMKIEFTRAFLRAALDGSLEKAPMRAEPVFGFLVPSECPGVPSEILDPRSTWSRSSDYDAQAKKLAVLFQENFVQFKDQSSNSVLKAGPQMG